MPDNFGFVPDQDSQQASAAAAAPQDFGFVADKEDAAPAQQAQQPSNPIATAGESALAGAANVGSAIGEGAYDAASWALKRSKIYSLMNVSDADADRAEQTVHEFFDKGRSSENGDQSDVFNRAVNQDLMINKVTKVGLGAGILAGAAVPNITAASSIPGVLANVGARAAGNAYVGAGLAGPGNQDQGAALGAALSPAGDAAAAGISSLAGKVYQAGQVLKNWIFPVSQAVNKSQNVAEQALQSESSYANAVLEKSNANWKPIDGIPGTINSQPIINNAQNIISNSRISLEGEQLNALGSTKAAQSTLSQPQLNILIGIQKQAANMQNMQDARLLKQEIANNYDSFSGKGVSKDLKNSYDNLKNTVDAAIKLKAENAGLGDAYNFANNFHQTNVIPLQKSGAIDRLNALQQQQKINAMGAIDPALKGSIHPAYTKALGSILPAKPTPAKLAQRLSQMDTNGKSIMEKYFIQSTFKNLDMQNLDHAGFNKMIGNLNSTIKDYKDVISPVGIGTLQGLKNTLMAARDANELQNESGSAYFKHNLGHVVGTSVAGGILGSGMGYAEGGQKGAMIGGLAGAAGIGAMPLLIKGLSKAVDTPAGQYMLQRLSSPQKARQMLNVLTTGPESQLSNGEE